MGVSKSRILIAEPDPDVQRTLQIYLETSGHEVQVMSEAGEVIRSARPWQPNVILMSAESADKDAYQVCRDLMNDTLTSHIPVVMLLRLNDRKARLAALEAGASDVISKPFDLEELSLRIEAAIRLTSMRLGL